MPPKSAKKSKLIVLISLLIIIFSMSSIFVRSTSAVTIAKPTYLRRRFGLGMTAWCMPFDGYDVDYQRFVDWYVDGIPYWSHLQLMIDARNMDKYDTENFDDREFFSSLRDVLIPAFNAYDISLALRISSPTYDDTTQKQGMLETLKELAGNPCLEKGYIYHDFEFGTWSDGRNWWENMPSMDDPSDPYNYKSYWYDWWYQELGSVGLLYVTDSYYTADALSELDSNGNPKYLWKSGNISPSRHEGIVAEIGPTESWMGAGHSCWQFEAKDDWEDPDYPSAQGLPGLGDYFLNLNFEEYEDITGTGSTAAQEMPFLDWGIEVNIFPWNPVGRDPYDYDPEFETLMKNLVYNNVVSRLDTYKMNLNSEGALALTVTVSSGGTTDPSPGIYAYNEGIDVSVTALPDADYLFENWELDGNDVGNTNPYTVLMDANHTLRAIFSPKPQATITGTVTDSTTDTPVSGASVTANEYSTTTNSTGQYSLSVSLGVYNLNVTKSGYGVWTGQVNASTAGVYTVDAQLVPIQQVYTLTITTSPGGTTDPSSGAHTYDEGTLVNVTAYPDPTYFLDHWELDAVNVGVDNPYSITMDGDHDLHAVFSTVPPATYSLKLNSTTGGTTDPSPGIYAYNEGIDVSVTALPDADYLFENWELDGNDVGNTNPYTVLMDANHTLRAIFSPKPQATITGTVTDSTTGAPISGALVTANEYSNTSDSDGSYLLEVPPDVYYLTVNTTGYEKWSDSVDVSVAGIHKIDVSIIPQKTTYETLASIAVQIHDLSTHDAISNAIVRIKDEPLKSQIKYTNSEGWANFTAVKNGTHLIIVSAEGYSAANETVSVITDAVYSVKLSRNTSSTILVTRIPEFDLLVATSLGAIAFFAIQRRFRNKKQKINRRLRQNHNR